MSTPETTTAPLAERLRVELELFRANVTGVYGSVVATSDGFLVAHDVPDLEPTEIAALAATTRALATRTTLAAGRGEFRETMARGSTGYLATYAAGTNAIVAVIGTNDLNVGMLRYQAREIIARIAANAPEFRNWSSSGAANGDDGSPAETGPRQDSPPPLPRRRPSSR
ncbi:MAG TPA: roadblock/LC7 domain-containing protein [Streptosporangiaceae bacterium]|jgi:uncharacterized protein|nr:roadblock/LC7 domain-containing protein [Streptosporangiaceae bacterium]